MWDLELQQQPDDKLASLSVLHAQMIQNAGHVLLTALHWEIIADSDTHQKLHSLRTRPRSYLAPRSLRPGHARSLTHIHMLLAALTCRATRSGTTTALLHCAPKIECQANQHSARLVVFTQDEMEDNEQSLDDAKDGLY